MEERQTGLAWINKTKDIYNSIPNGSRYLIAPCEINTELVRVKCENWTGSSCELGVLMKEGVAYCPLQEEKQLTLRNSYASTESQDQNLS